MRTAIEFCNVERGVLILLLVGAMVGICHASESRSYALIPVFLVGQTIPEIGGGTFFELPQVVMNNVGTIAFSAKIREGEITDGIFIYAEGRITRVAVAGQGTGDPAPGTGGGTFDL